MSDWEVAPDAGGSDWAVVDDEEGGPESFLHPDKFKPSPQHRKFKNTGPIARVREELDPRQVWAAPNREHHNASDVINSADDYLESSAAPVLSAIDRMTLGGLGAGLRGATKINQATGTDGPTLASRSLEAIEGYRGNHPTASRYTDIPGYMFGGPRMLATAAERVLPQVAHPAAQAARATLGAGMSSGAISGAESYARGDQPAEIAREAGRGAAGGAIVGAPLSVGALMLRGAANAVLGSKGAQAREYLTSRSQPLSAPDTSDAAIGAAAQRTDSEVKSAMQAYKGQVASGPYMDAIHDITPEQAGELVDVAPLYRNLKAAASDPTNLQSADKLNTLAHMLEQHRMTLADGSETLLMTQEQVNGLRRSLGSISGVGESTAAKLSPLRDAFSQAKALVDQGPYAEANRRNTAGMADLNQSLDMVGLDTSTNPDNPITGNLRVASQRQGQNTVTAGADTERLDIEAFKRKHPELANVIDAPEILRKQGDISYHASGPSHGGLIDRLAGGFPLPAMIAAYAMGHGWKGALSVPAMLAIQNRNAIAGRALYNPAQNAQIAAQMMLQGTPAIAAPGREVIQERR